MLRDIDKIAAATPAAEPSRADAGRDERIASLVASLGRARPLDLETTWPGGTLAIRLRILSSAERLAARQAAQAWVAADAARVREHASRVMTECLIRAILDPATGRPLFEASDELLAVATDDELASVYRKYADHRSMVDPDVDSLTPEELGELEEAIKKKDPTALNAIASSMPRRSLLFTVARLASCLSDNSSTTTSSSPEPSPPPAAQVEAEEDEDPEEDEE